MDNAQDLMKEEKRDICPRRGRGERFWLTRVLWSTVML